MATKLDHSSAAEARQPKPSLAPKLSIFGTKAGFVIPKNKLAGSLVIRSSTIKNETPAVSKEEHSKHVQRKTKWAPDLALEPAVCKGRALAYQVWHNSLLVSSTHLNIFTPLDSDFCFHFATRHFLQPVSSKLQHATIFVFV